MSPKSKQNEISPKNISSGFKEWFKSSEKKEKEKEKLGKDKKEKETQEEQEKHKMIGLDYSSIKIQELEKGAYFGEIGLITLLKRTANVTSMDYCTLSFLKKSALDEAQDQFPEIY